MSSSHMHSTLFLALSVFLLSNLPLVTSASDRTKQVPLFTYEDLRTCYFAEDSCRACWSECPTTHQAFFGSTQDTKVHERRVQSLQQCLRATRYYRKWLPDWCINDRHGFYAIEKVPASTENCLMQPFACSQHIEQTGREQFRLNKWPNGRFKLSLLMGKLGRMQRNLSAEFTNLEKRKEMVARITQARNEKWLEEAEVHIKNPEENDTKYADPVFQNYRGVLQENRELDNEVSKNNLTIASEENESIRKKTMGKIPNYLRSIQRLKNNIHSKKSKTDQYLEQIKEIAARTFVLQDKATNIIYEATYSKELDGEISVLDKQLLDLYIQLKKERTNLLELNIRTTFSKLRLVGVMRMTIQQITQQQIQKGCSLSEVMGF